VEKRKTPFIIVKNEVFKRLVEKYGSEIDKCETMDEPAETLKKLAKKEGIKVAET
jgi:hypothetical protein